MLLLDSLGFRPAETLQLFTSAVQAYQKCFEELYSWFPEIQIGQPPDEGLLDTQRQGARIIHDLGLQNQTLESVTQLAGKVERLRTALQTAITLSVVI